MEFLEDATRLVHEADVLFQKTLKETSEEDRTRGGARVYDKIHQARTIVIELHKSGIDGPAFDAVVEQITNLTTDVLVRLFEVSPDKIEEAVKIAMQEGMYDDDSV